jgi:phosphoribosylanthranilate isomerase
MSVTKVKICGLTRMQDTKYVNEILPDYIGFVFAKSRRQISPETAYQLKIFLDNRIAAVGVFVNESINIIADICSRGIINLIQLHGDESDEYIRVLRKEVSVPIIKAIRVKSMDSLREAGQSSCDYLLLDSYSEKQLGGTGKTFDWKFAKSIGKPFFLAGGIQIENAKSAIEIAKPYSLDVSSGVETDGLKDRNKIKQLVNLVRGH